jgi:hypothetical protein
LPFRFDEHSHPTLFALGSDPDDAESRLKIGAPDPKEWNIRANAQFNIHNSKSEKLNF